MGWPPSERSARAALSEAGATNDQIEQMFGGVLVEEAFTGDQDPAHFDSAFVKESFDGLPKLAALQQDKLIQQLMTLFQAQRPLTVVMQPGNPLAQGAFVPLLVAMFYCLMGLWRGVRLLITGIVVAALTLIGFFYLPEYFMLWMAAVGGGSLILLGLWLRKV